MPKLKGLLDSANAKLAGLLGDFPQGFNAGAVAGFPGWAGDMAYLADTARLALTGADSQAAPEDYVGTTDYIAKQAGYPVPQTLSGQLGAAVGGLMSPGPGDLAKFAPVLSAIPFWHGSPHKYDAVDLSKIGTGEGAQAYGHGYYGADAKETAEQYQRVLGGEDTQFFVGDKQVFPEQMDAFESSALNAIAYGNTPEQALANYESQGVQQDALDELKPILERFHNAGVKRVDLPKENSSLYRGEYRWPDPAKEAATPLTGEDLLDWDRPLSEQPAILAKLKDNYAIADDPSLTGGDFYKRLGSEVGGDPDEISAALLSDGIPGIRYLDQMSRGAGDGTRNYVMFDDKGIKLLERNGEPIKAAEDFAARRAGKAKPYRELAMDEASRIQRASEQGYNTDVYHGTAEDVTAFDPAKFGASTGAHSAKQGVWTVSDETTAAGYAQYAANDAKIKALLDDAAKWEKKGDWDKYDEAVAAAEDLEKTNRDNDFMGGQNVMPLKVRGKYLEQDMGGAEFVDVERDIKTLIDKARRAGYDGVKFHNLADDVGRNARPATHVLTFDPKNIRSKNAAFDPAKKDSANLLAGAAATALGLGLAKQQLSEQERRNGM